MKSNLFLYIKPQLVLAYKIENLCFAHGGDCRETHSVKMGGQFYFPAFGAFRRCMRYRMIDSMASRERFMAHTKTYTTPLEKRAIGSNGGKGPA